MIFVLYCLLNMQYSKHANIATMVALSFLFHYSRFKVIVTQYQSIPKREGAVILKYKYVKSHGKVFKRSALPIDTKRSEQKHSLHIASMCHRLRASSSQNWCVYTDKPSFCKEVQLKYLLRYCGQFTSSLQHRGILQMFFCV